MEHNMANRIQIRRDTSANWLSVNPILAQGELGYELDTGRLKVGNGTLTWSALSYFGNEATNVPTNLSDFNNDVGFITGFVESDPTVGSHIKSISALQVSNWDTSYSWGDHRQEGYALSSNLSSVATSGSYADLSNRPNIPSSLTDLGIVDGSNGQVLIANGNGTFTFTTVGSSGISPTIDTTNATTTSLSPFSTENINLEGGRAYILYKIQTSHAAWVRVYINNESRTTDAGRLQGVDPDPKSGVIAEVITSGSETIVFSPAVQGFNDEFPSTSVTPIAVTNLSGANAAITVTMTKLTLVA